MKFKNSILRSSFCDFSDAYILIKGTIIVPNAEGAGTATNNINKKIIFKNCAPFIDCIVIDRAKDMDVVIPMYSLIEHGDNYSKTSGGL